MESATTAITGAYSSANVIDDSVLEIASFAVDCVHTTSQFREFASNASSSIVDGPLELVRIISAETQVVAGRNYKLKLELKAKGSDQSSIVCDLVVWDQPWTSTRKITQAQFTAM